MRALMSSDDTNQLSSSKEGIQPERILFQSWDSGTSRQTDDRGSDLRSK